MNTGEHLNRLIAAGIITCLVGLTAVAQSEPNLAELEARIAKLEANETEQALLSSWPGFEFHGYMRSGFGSNGEGGAIEAFRAPNAGAKYRLGNEAETYLETAFRQNLVPRKGESKFGTQVLIAYVTPSSSNNDFDSTITLREAFADASGVLEFAPEAEFWAGQRFYDRWDIHMNDFYYRDLSGFGGGVQKVEAGPGIMSLAWLGGTISEVRSDGLPREDPESALNNNTFDVRMDEIKLPLGKLGLSFDAVYFDGDDFTRDGDEHPISVENSAGWGVGIYYTIEDDSTYRNRFVAQYGNGVASSFRSVITPPPHLIIDEGESLDMDEFKRLLLINDFVVDTQSGWSLTLAAVYDYYDLGQGGNDKLEWYSLGARPVYFFTEHLSLAIEAGWDYTDTEGGAKGSLWKATIAPQITPASHILSRPALRAFVTYAWWSDEFRGSVAENTYSDETEGLSAGLQMETWW